MANRRPLRGAFIIPPPQGAVADLLNQAVEGGDPGGGFAAAKESGVMHIQGGQVGPGAGALVLMFDLQHHPGPWRLCRMAAVARLNARLLIGRDHEVVRRQGVPSQTRS